MDESRLQRQNDSLSALLGLSREVRHADTPRTLQYVFTNETQRLVDYSHALLWSFNELGQLHVVGASSITEVDPHAPFVQWARALASTLAKAEDAALIHPVEADNLNSSVRDEWSQWCPGSLLWMPISSPGGVPLGGLLLFREASWAAGEIALLQEAADAFGHAWHAVRGGNESSGRRLLRALAGRRGLAAVVLMLAKRSICSQGPECECS